MSIVRVNNRLWCLWTPGLSILADLTPPRYPLTVPILTEYHKRVSGEVLVQVAATEGLVVSGAEVTTGIDYGCGCLLIPSGAEDVIKYLQTKLETCAE